MRKADAAERILSLTTTPDRAASVAGDLVEQAGVRGTFWFWVSVLRTMTALGWRTFAGAPLRLTGLAAYAAFIQMFYLLVATIGITLPHVIILSTLGFTREQAMPGGYIAYVETLLAFVVAVFLFGKWLTRKAPQRELAVYAISWLMLQVPWIAVLLIWPSTSRYSLVPDMVQNALATIIGTIFTFAGVERARKQTAATRLTSSR